MVSVSVRRAGGSAFTLGWRVEQTVTVANSTPIRKRLWDDLRPNLFIAQPNRSIRVGLAFCQPEVALRELAWEADPTSELIFERLGCPATAK